MAQHYQKIVVKKIDRFLEREVSFTCNDVNKYFTDSLAITDNLKIDNILRFLHQKSRITDLKYEVRTKMYLFTADKVSDSICVTLANQILFNDQAFELASDSLQAYIYAIEK
ncbi:MAG: hypothetical protein JST10_16100 [Bacteroidetes bacterium]|nr:hypothetical protein [Bacteroidota bacterium]